MGFIGLVSQRPKKPITRQSKKCSMALTRSRLFSQKAATFSSEASLLKLISDSGLRSCVTLTLSVVCPSSYLRTQVRFDPVYVGHFKCNIRTIRDGYPNIHRQDHLLSRSN